MTPTMSTLLAGYDRTAESLRELARRDADLARHPRGSVKQHLVSVHDVLVRWGQPEPVRLAGLLHSAYAVEARGFCLFHWTERARVSEILGHDAERLVLAFSGCEHDALIAAAEQSTLPVRLATRWEAIAVDLDRRDLARLMVILAAHLACDVCSQRGGPATWLPLASRILVAARANIEVAPPVFEGGTIVMTLGEEASLLQTYRALLRTSVLRAGTSSADAVASSPVGEPLVLAGLVALANRRGPDAAALAARAHAAFDAWGVAWDKRLPLPRWRQLADLLARDGQARDAQADVASWRAETVLAAGRGSPERIWSLFDSRDAFGSVAPAAPRVLTVRAPDVGRGSLPPRFVEYIGGLRGNVDRPLLQFYPGLRAMPWHDPGELAIAMDLERLAPEIAAEARSFDTLEVQDEAEQIRRAGRWSVAFLLEMGRRSEQNLDRCPVTRWVLEKHHTRMTDAGSVYFSCLAPHTRIAPHRGPTNVRLRCHLGLEVPAGCGLRVAGDVRRWEEGRCIVFDDSFTHEAWNDSDRRRVVLILDVWHPDLSDDEIALLAGLHRYGTTSDASLRQYWASNEAARDRARAESAAIAAVDDHPADTPAAAASDEGSRAQSVEAEAGAYFWHSEQSLAAIGLASLGAIRRR